MVIERFLWGSSFRGRHFRSAEEMDGNALRISNFSKRYNNAAKKRDRTLAVDELSLDVFAGTIMVLLGANGSGKSTTLSSIAGLESITHGRIDIDNSGGVGLCPQSNVMWGDMTVEEHVWFFQRLKNPSLPRKEGRQETQRLIDQCDLKRKTYARAKTLSGGQQRKLQLSMMLAGGSRVCCIDEASSGIDPLARRKIWNILLRERGHRTMLLTTHFLDESEVLADHIALLSKGKLRAQGTVAELKANLGNGFRVVLSNVNRSTATSFPEGTSISVRQEGNETIFEVPDSETLTLLLSKLDQQGLSDYQIEGPSVEKIFLRLADEMKASELQDKDAASHEERSKSMDLYTGKGCGPVKQTGILFRKRLTILKHNFMPYVAALFVPLVVAGLVTRFLLNVSSAGLQCRDPDQTYYYQPVPQSLQPFFAIPNTLIGPPSEVTSERLYELVPNGTFCSSYGCSSYSYETRRNATEVTSLSDFNAQIQNIQNSGQYRQGGFYMDPPTIAFLAQGYYGIPAASRELGTLDMALTNTSVAVSYSNFEQGYAPRDFYQSLVAVFTTLGFVLFPGLFALYPTRERLNKVRAMQYSNGITSGPLWTAYALFDFTFLLLIAVLVTVIWVANGYAWFGLGYMFL